MSKVLYITAHPLTEERSSSLATGKAFIEEYQKANPHDDIVHINLYRDYIPMIDADVMNGWEKLRAGGTFDQLTEQEQGKVARLNELVDQFVGADKYVFVTPFWNLSYPPMLKAYLDAVSVAGKAFKYVAGGQLVGLLTEKKALHIQARGSVFAESPYAELEMGHRHLEIMMKFFGLPGLEALILEGLDRTEFNREEIKENAVRRAKELAYTF